MSLAPTAGGGADQWQPVLMRPTVGGSWATVSASLIGRGLGMILTFGLIACRAAPGTFSPSISAAPSSSSFPSPSASSSAGSALCNLVPAAALESLLEAQVVLNSAATNASGCTYTVQQATSTAPSWDLNLRIEQGFENLAAARAAFAGGQEVSGLSGNAYWAPDVGALWFENAQTLYAVQLIGFDEGRDDAMTIARAVAELALQGL